jgi:hypothetical protein
MHDQQYRWQDHVPPTVGVKANLMFAAAFLVAALAIGGFVRTKSEAAQQHSIAQSINNAAPPRSGHSTADDHGLFVSASAPSSGSARVLMACAQARPQS